MAEKEDIRKRMKQLNPAMVEFSDKIDHVLAKHGITGAIEMVEGMTPEEEEMAVYAGLVKEGCPAKAAEIEAKAKLAQFRKIFPR